MRATRGNTSRSTRSAMVIRRRATSSSSSRAPSCRASISEACRSATEKSAIMRARSRVLECLEAGVIREVRRLAELGAVNFRLGGQADFFSYRAIGLGSSATPQINGPAIRELLEGIRAAAPNLRVLHTDNGDPAMMVAHPEEAMAAMRDLVAFATPGTSLSFRLESADPRVTAATNLNIDADGCLAAMRMVNAVGRERGENGMPRLLPGLNFVAGLEGETEKTFDLNLAFLKRLLNEDLWVRRINIRQVRPVRREFEPTGLYREFP